MLESRRSGRLDQLGPRGRRNSQWYEVHEERVFGEGIVLNYEGSGDSARVQVNFDQSGKPVLRYCLNDFAILALLVCLRAGEVASSLFTSPALTQCLGAVTPAYLFIPSL